jgi:hypothetical protein
MAFVLFSAANRSPHVRLAADPNKERECRHRAQRSESKGIASFDGGFSPMPGAR